MMIATIKMIVISGGLATPTLSVEAFASLECDDSRCRLSSICVCAEEALTLFVSVLIRPPYTVALAGRGGAVAVSGTIPAPLHTVGGNGISMTRLSNSARKLVLIESSVPESMRERVCLDVFASSLTVSIACFLVWQDVSNGNNRVAIMICRCLIIIDLCIPLWH